MFDKDKSYLKYIKMTYFRNVVAIWCIIKNLLDELMFWAIEDENIAKIKKLYKMHKTAKKKTIWKSAQEILNLANKKRFIDQFISYFLAWLKRFQRDSFILVDDNDFVVDRETIKITKQSNVHNVKFSSNNNESIKSNSDSCFSTKVSNLCSSEYQRLSNEEMRHTNNFQAKIQNFRFWKNQKFHQLFKSKSSRFSLSKFHFDSQRNKSFRTNASRRYFFSKFDFAFHERYSNDRAKYSFR